MNNNFVLGLTITSLIADALLIKRLKSVWLKCQKMPGQLCLIMSTFLKADEFTLDGSVAHFHSNYEDIFLQLN
jgi:hypothetical protein